MAFDPFEVNVPHITYACLGGFVVLFGMFSLFLREKIYIGEACWAFLFGVIVGPYCAGIFDPHDWGGGNEDVVNTVTLELTRVVLAVGVFAIGVELPKAYMKRHWKSLFFLLGPVMTYGWFVSAGLIYGLIPGLSFLSSLAIAACLTPTDPILAAAVVGGKYADKHVPAHIRHLLAAESGCNDGAAFPFLYIAIYLIIHNHDAGKAIKDWFLLLWLYQVILGVVIGASLGIGFRYLMKFCERHNLIDRHSYVAQYISLALFATGVTALLGSDDLLSSFACGTAFAWDGFFNRQTEESNFSSVLDLLFNIATFVYVGAWMPFDKFSDAELTLSVWRLIVLAICVLILRRLPVVLALYKWIPDIKTFREAIFSGHFGPIGVGGIFISTLAAEVLHKNVEEPDEQTHLLIETIQPVVAFMVICSILIHGLSIPSFSLGRRVHSVSRTWSRHTGVPDWTNQARVVDNRDEIVVNRDDDSAEKGELTPEDRTEIASTRDGSKDSEKEKEVLPEKELEDQTTAKTTQLPPAPAGEEPVDGLEIISQWQEGPHRVIERRAGPGEEVEVEVIKNYGSEESSSHTVRGDRRTAHEQVKIYMDRLRSIPQIIEDDVSKLEQDISDFGHRMKENFPSHSSVNSAVVDDGDDEDWASEPEVSTADRKARSKSPKLKAAAAKAGLAGRGRRRMSGSARKPSVRDEQRGRRVDELRRPTLERLSRDVSPARSVRFAESSRSGSGTSTPKMMVESPDSGRFGVTFNVPSGGEGRP